MQELDYGFCATQGARGYQEDTALARSGLGWWWVF